MKDLRRKRIPVLWSTVGETALAKGFCSNKGDIQSVSVWTDQVSHCRTDMYLLDLYFHLTSLLLNSALTDAPSTVTLHAFRLHSREGWEDKLNHSQNHCNQLSLKPALNSTTS